MFCHGFRVRFARACAVVRGAGPRGCFARARKRAVTERSCTHAAKRFARDRVERSEFVWSALGERKSTNDDSPVAVLTMLSFMPAAIWRPNEFPEIVPVL